MVNESGFTKIALDLLKSPADYGSRYKLHHKVSEESETYSQTQERADNATDKFLKKSNPNPSDDTVTKQITQLTYRTTADQLIIDDRPEDDRPEDGKPQNNRIRFDLKINSPDRLLPTETGFTGLLKIILDDTTKSLIMIAGNRGVGKTHSINYFISQFFKKELAPKKYTYLRCDASKMLDIFKKLDKNSREIGNITIEEYIRAHILYIALKYGKNDALLKKFNSRTQDCEGSFKKFLNDNNYTQEAELWEYWVKHAPAEKSQHTQTQFLADAIQKERDGNLEISKNLYKQIIYIIREHEEGHIILIIDGVDNYSQEQHGDIYHELVDELIQFFPEDSSSEYDKIILCLRTITYYDLRSRVHNHNCRERNPEIFLVAPINPEEFLKHCVDTVPNKESVGAEFFPKSEEPEEPWDKKFLESTSRTLADLASEVGIETPRKTFQILFNGNLRSLFRNMYLTHIYCSNIGRNLQHLPQGQKRDTRQSSANYFTQTNRKINQEASMLSGAAFMPPHTRENDDYIIGRWCPNLFYYIPRSMGLTQGIWDGLSMLRLLQYCDPKHQEQGRAHEDIIHDLNDYFGYLPDSINRNFLRAIKFGMIECTDSLVYSKSEKLGLGYLRSQKGSLLIKNIFEKPNIFYFMAASTWLPSDWIENTQLIFLHNPHSSDRQFYQAVIKTGISFWRVLKKEHSREMIYHQSFEHKEEEEDFLKVFKLPSPKVWLKRAEILYSTLQGNRSSGAFQLLEDLRGQTNKN